MAVCGSGTMGPSAGPARCVSASAANGFCSSRSDASTVWSSFCAPSAPRSVASRPESGLTSRVYCAASALTTVVCLVVGGVSPPVAVPVVAPVPVDAAAPVAAASAVARNCVPAMTFTFMSWLSWNFGRVGAQHRRVIAARRVSKIGNQPSQ